MNSKEWIVTITAAIAMTTAIVAFVDPWHATEPEVYAIVASEAPSKADINHLSNVRTDDLIEHIMPSIVSLEQKVDLDLATTKDVRKLARLQEEKKRYESRYIPDGHLHGQSFLIIGEIDD